MYTKNFDNKIHLIFFSDGPIYENKKKLILNSYENIGQIDKIDIWNKSRIQKTNFYKDNKEIFNETKGFGLWIWKPYIINDLMQRVDENDFIIYVDLNIYHNVGFQQSVIPLLNYLNENELIIPGIHLHSEKYNIKNWVNNKVLKYTNADIETIFDKNICLTSFQIWRKNKISDLVIKLWLKICTNIKVIKSEKVEEDYLMVPQNEQTILSALIINCKLLVPSPRGPFPDNYCVNECDVDLKKKVFSYVRLLKDFNYLFKLAIDDKIPEFIKP